MIKLTYYTEWPGERAAGINPGSEEVEVILKHTHTVDEEMTEYWRESIAEYFDGAKVRLVSWERIESETMWCLSKKFQKSA